MFCIVVDLFGAGHTYNFDLLMLMNVIAVWCHVKYQYIWSRQFSGVCLYYVILTLQYSEGWEKSVVSQEYECSTLVCSWFGLILRYAAHFCNMNVLLVTVQQTGIYLDSIGPSLDYTTRCRTCHNTTAGLISHINSLFVSLFQLCRDRIECIMGSRP